MKLIDHVLNIRRLIQQSFDNRFSRMGLKVDTTTPIEQLPEKVRKRRVKLEQIMQSHLLELQGDYEAARQATINECVFSLFNRIAAIKVMEAKELFPEIITRRKENAGRSFEHNAWLEDHPEERNAEREGLKHFLIDQFDKLGENIPLYKADYPYALMPTADELNEIIDAFNAVEADQDCGVDVWKGDDILGWLYENFNDVEKKLLKDYGEKIEYDKVSLQSQVYTPQWVVKFLVDNTLGKSYLEMFPDSRIKEKYQIANVPTERVKHPKEITEMKLLDPACGSGNFLIYAFSLFYDLYTDQMENYGKEYSRRDIPKMIVENNLYGVDLDERAAQISQIALFIKARELGGHRSHWPAYTNVVSTHFFLPQYSEIEGAFDIVGSWDSKQKAAIPQIWGDLANAYKFGSLIRVEERLNELLPDDVNHSIFKEEEMLNLFSFKNNITTQLRNQVNNWSGQGSNPYTLAKTNDAISFLEIISHKFDVVVANPPYTDSGDYGQELKKFVEDNYKKPYKCNSNLYACFIKRCCELATCDGKVGMIHPMTFMYIKTFEDVRKFMLDDTHISLFVEYGLSNLFGSIMVDPAFYVLEKNKKENIDSLFISLDQYTRTPEERNKKTYCLQALNDIVNQIHNKHVYSIPQDKFKGIKSYPYIYWISDSLRNQFSLHSLEKEATVITGIKTGNNSGALRYHWEVLNKNKWGMFTKGGDFNKWYGNNWLVINKENNFEYIKQQNSYTIPREEYLYREAITFPESSTKGSCFRYLESNVFFSNKSSSIFSKEVFFLLGIMNSPLISYFTECLNPTVDTELHDIKRLPLPKFSDVDINKKIIIKNIVKQIVEIKKHLCKYSLVEPLYSGSPISTINSIKDSICAFYYYENSLITQILLSECIINRTVIDIYKLDEHDKQMVLEKEGIPIGDLPLSREAKALYRKWLIDESEFKPCNEVFEHLDALEECNDLPKITDFDSLYQNNNEWEEFCIKHKVNPVEAWYQFSKTGILPPQRTQVLAFELLTDVIRAVLAKDDDGVIPLGDKMGEERLALRIEREMMERGYSAAQFQQVCQILGCPLEKFLQERFFQQLSDHLNLFMYLPKTPFIWHLSSGPHHAMELYISIYRWSRDTLFRIRSVYAANREAALRDQLHSLDTSTTGGRLEAKELQDMLTELQKYCEKIDDLLASGYDPALDDGVGKNIAPLQKRGMISYEVLTAGELRKYLNADW